MNNVWATLLVFLFFFTSHAFAWIEKPLPRSLLAEKEVRLGLTGAYLKNQKNFDSTGAKLDLATDNFFQTMQGSLFLEYGIMRDATVYADVSMLQNQVKATNTSTGGTTTNTESGAGDADIGLRFRVNEKPVRAILEAIAQFPLYSRVSTDSLNRFTSDTPVPRGNGATEISLLAIGEYPLLGLSDDDGEFAIGALLGATARSAGLSNTLPYKIYAKYERPLGLFASFGLAGQGTLSNDKFSASLPTLVRDRNTISMGGSSYYNAVNPTFLKLDALVGGYLSDQFFASVGGQLPLSGKNTPTEPLLLASLGFRFGGKEHVEKDQTEHVKRSKGPKGFQEYYMPSRVIQSNNPLKLLLIDKGRNDGIVMGELLDVFEPNRPDGNPGAPLARARVMEIGPTRTKLQTIEFFKQSPDGTNPRIEEGFVVKRPLR